MAAPAANRALHLYSLGGCVVGSDRPLRGMAAPAARASRPDILIQVAPRRERAPRASHWFHGWTGPGRERRTRMRFATLPQGYLVDVPRAAKFVVTHAGDRIACHPAPGLATSSFGHLLVDQVLPLALGLRGGLVLHASAVAGGGEALAFAGQSGRGKSTLAAHLAGRGATVLTDDCLVLRETRGRWLAFPFERSLRLDADSARAALGGRHGGPRMAPGSGKRRVRDHPALGFRRAPAPVRALVLLQAPRRGLRRPVLERLSPREALMSLLPLSFFFEVHRRLALRAQLERLGRLVERVPAYSLTLPRGLERLGEACAALSELRAAARR